MPHNRLWKFPSCAEGAAIQVLWMYKRLHAMMVVPQARDLSAEAGDYSVSTASVYSWACCAPCTACVEDASRYNSNPPSHTADRIRSVVYPTSPRCYNTGIRRTSFALSSWLQRGARYRRPSAKKHYGTAVGINLSVKDVSKGEVSGNFSAG